MKVYFLKTDLSQYQIFPEPLNLEDFIVLDIENESVLEEKQLVFKDNQYVLINRETAFKRELIEKLMNNVDNTAASILSKWTRFAEEYKLREAAAIAFKNANFEGEVNIYISSFATVAGLDNKSATLLILKQAEGLRALQEQLAVQRMRKYELKHEELSNEELQRIHDDIISTMQQLAEVQQ